MIYFKDSEGKTHEIDVFTVINNGVVSLYCDNVLHTLKVYYRHEKTWNDHMGNTPCGYFVNVPVNGKKKRIYIHCRGWQ